MFAFKTRLLLVLVWVKGLLVPLHDTPPTEDEIVAYADYEDMHGYCMYPSPTERYEDAVAWRDGMLEFSLFTLLRWRLAVAWMPFCKGETRLIGEWASRKLFPDLWRIRREKKVRAGMAAPKRRVDW